MKEVGEWWDDRDIKVVEIDGEYLALNGWNGESFVDCFYVKEEWHGRFFELDAEHEGTYCADPVYDDLDEIIDYRVYV